MSQTMTTDASPANERRSTAGEWLPVVIVVVTILFVAAIRLRIANTPLERDEGEFAYAGQLIRQGEVPYNDCYNIKLPGTYAAYAVIMTLFGETPVGIHVGLLLINAASIALMYVIGKKLHGKTTGAIAAVVFALLTLDSGLYGFAAHATHFVVLFALLGFYFLLRSIEGKGLVDCFASGICMGISFVCKQPGLAFGMMALGFFIWLAVKHSRHSLWLYFIVGWLAPYELVCLTMWMAGSFEIFWLWTVKYAAAHSRSVSELLPRIATALHACPVRIRAFAFVIAPAVIYVALHPTIPVWKRLFVFALLVSSVAAVTAGFYFYLHYFIMLIPAVALIVAMALQTSAADLRARGAGERASFLPATATGLWAIATIITLSDYLFVNSPDKIVAQRYVGNAFVQTRKVATYLATNLPPKARIAVLQSEPEMLVYTHQRSSTGFIYAYDLTAPSRVRFDLENQFKHDLTVSNPEYVVFVCLPFAWTPQDRAGLALADWCYAFAQSNSTRIAIADGLMPEYNETVYKWGSEVGDYKRKYPTFIEVYRRNP